MIANRYYKTTIGVPFELVLGLQASLGGTRTTFKTFMDTSPVLGDYNAFVEDGTKLNKSLTMGTAITAAQKKFPVYFSYLKAVTGGVGEPINTTPVLGDSIRSEIIAYRAPAFQSAEVALTAGTPQITQEISFKIIETTPGNSNLPVWDYNKLIVIDSDTTLAAITVAINADPDNDNWTASDVSHGIRIVSRDVTRHFRLAISTGTSTAQPLDDTTWTYTLNTAASAGSGTVAHVRQLEYESNVKRGITAQYPEAGFRESDFGTVVSMLDAIIGAGTTTFDLVMITGTKYESSPTPIEIHHNICYFFIAVPAGQGAAIQTTFV